MSYYPESKVEVHGWAARHYDRALNVLSLGSYFPMIKRAVRAMNIKPGDRILDLGTGSGKNACLMMRSLSEAGELVGLDISQDMIRQFRKRCAGRKNATVAEERIDRPLPYKEEFDKVFICFVLHGFPQEARLRIIRNAFQALKMSGEFFILDYSEFSMADMPFYLREIFRRFECRYAFDFIERDWRAVLGEEGFGRFESRGFFRRYVRLLKAVKTEKKPSSGRLA